MAASRFLTFAAIGLAAVQPALAQVAPLTTVLHLSATGSVQVAPDQLAAELVAQSTSSSAAMAQRQVNSMMANGMKAAQAIVGVDARAVGYSVVPGDEKHATWVAQQTLELRGADGLRLPRLGGHPDAFVRGVPACPRVTCHIHLSSAAG